MGRRGEGGVQSKLPARPKRAAGGEVSLRVKLDHSGLTIAGKSRALSAADQLLGAVVGIPADYLEGLRRRNELRREARERFLEADIAAAMQQVEGLSSLGQATMQRLLSDEYRKQQNRASVWLAAEEHLLLAPDGGETNSEAGPEVEEASINADWMNKFSSFAQDISDEDLQIIWGKLLAGEILRPGSFSLSTLRVISELDQSIANDFSLAWSKDVGGSVDYSPEWRRGEWFARWRRLSEAGLMAENSVAQYLPSMRPESGEIGLWAPVGAGREFLNIAFRKNSSCKWDHIEFTRVGREIGNILPRPNYDLNLRSMAGNLSKSGIVSITLVTSQILAKGELGEVIWREGA